MNIKKITKNRKIGRRSFLKMLAALSSLGLSMRLPFLQWGKVNEAEGLSLMLDWKTDQQGNKYFVPQNIKTDSVNSKGIMVARIDGQWKKYQVREFNNDFHEWWIEEKLWYYDKLIAFIEGETDQFTVPNGGHHHPMLSTYGKKFGGRDDSDFHLNTTAKGVTIIPKAENIKSITEEIKKVSNGNSPVDILKLKRKLYQEKDLWDKTRFATLELYTGRPLNAQDPTNSLGFTETHTFQNISVNPMATLTYMSIYNTSGNQAYFEGIPYLTPHFEFRGFGWLISYYNPKNSSYEKAIADYINQSHVQFHGGISDITTLIFVIAEEFNNTPGYGPGLGKRVVPPKEYSSKKTRTKPVKIKPKMTRGERIELIKRLHFTI